MGTAEPHVASSAATQLTDGFQLVIDALKLNGIDTLFALPGIPITDLTRRAQAEGLRVLSFRHEQNAGYAASIAGFLTQKPGICLTVSAPGFLNGLNALAHATTNCFPMILISGSSEREIVDLQQGDYEELASIAETQEPISPTTGASMRTLLSASCGEMSIWMNLWPPQSFALLPPQVLPLPCESSQFRRAPISITTSAAGSTNERAAEAHCSCVSGSSPFAIDMGRYGIPVFSMRFFISASACAYAAPLPRMMSGFFAERSKSSARFTASGAGICLGAGSTTLMSVRLPASASIACAKSFAGRSR